MGNPHPTRSKPIKIGRKHTGAPSSRVKGRRQSATLAAQKIKAAKIRKFKLQVRAFWAEKRENFPAKP